MIERPIQLPPGVYLNAFPVDISPTVLTLMRARNLSSPQLQALRAESRSPNSGLSLFVETRSGMTYAYGKNASLLSIRGFDQQTVDLRVAWELGRRMITDGLLGALQAEGLDASQNMGLISAREQGSTLASPKGEVQLSRKFQIRTLSFPDPSHAAADFAVSVDLAWDVRGAAGQPIGPRQVAALGLASQVAQAQGELLPGTQRVNLELAKARLLDVIIPFVVAHSNFELSGGGRARISPNPIRVTIGEEGQDVLPG